MKILITPDVDDWAIGSLTKSIIKHNPRFNWTKVCVHPRGLANSFLALSDALEKGIDLWHAQYWHSAMNILDKIEDFKNLPSLLSHLNHNSLTKKDWKVFNGLSHPTYWGSDVLRKKHNNVYQIPFGIDLDRYEYNDDYPEGANTVGYIGRVLPHKHLADICMVAKKNNYKVIGSGYIEKLNYWTESCKGFLDDGTLDFKGGVDRTAMTPASIKDNLYKKMRVFVMYSTGEYESGTLPLFEAMACGVPVMATAQGSARDLIEHGKNGIIFTPETFEEELNKLMNDPKLCQQLRKNAWQTIKNYSEQRMARRFAKVYYDIVWNKQPVVSVIIPTFNRCLSLTDTILSVDNDEYPAKEIVIADDGSTDETRSVVANIKKKIKTPIMYVNTGETNKYGLAKARNMAVVESLGEVLLFLDDRLNLKKHSLQHISEVPDGEWHFGAKQTKTGISTKRTFIENFSWIKREDFVRGGMFNERMGYYGGMSQILREQYNEKVEFIYDDKATAIEMLRARRGRRKDIWKAKDIINKLYD